MAETIPNETGYLSMWTYIIRRIIYAIPILLGVNILTFSLFFFVNSPDQIARVHLGGKYITKEVLDDWKKVHGYDLPLFYNKESKGFAKYSETLFFQKSLKLFLFDFGLSDTGRDIIQSIRERYLPSLLLAIPTLFLGLFVNIYLALILSFMRGTYLDILGVFSCVVLISISTLFFIIAGQYVIAKLFLWLPISGYVGGINAFKFLLLPIMVGIVASLGGGVKWYRALFLEEMTKDYVRTARAKGLSEWRIMFSHVLKNALIPILTGIVVILPLLFMGSLLMESFFSIPGLGSYTIDAIREQDFAIVRAMVFIGTLLYILGLILTDISYAVVDPRIRLP